MKTAIVLAISLIAQAIGNTCLSKEMKAIAAAFDSAGGFSLDMVFHIAGSPMIWLGTLLLAAFFILFAVALSWADLSFVQPVTAFGYILNVALARHYLNEPISTTKWAGTALIIGGVILLSKSAVSHSSESGKVISDRVMGGIAE